MLSVSEYSPSLLMTGDPTWYYPELGKSIIARARHPLSLGEGEPRVGGELGSIVSIGIVCWKSQIKSYGVVSIEKQAVKDLQHPVLMRQ